MNCFMKISYNQWRKDWDKYMCPPYNDTDYISRANGNKDLDAICKEAYDNISIPVRSTMGSAGYDFKLPYSISINYGRGMILTGISWVCDSYDLELDIYPRSSVATKYGFTFHDTTPIIDSDYWHADNQGHILLPFYIDYSIPMEDVIPTGMYSGMRIAQGIIRQFVKVDDDNVMIKRTGGFGSTGI